MPFRSGYAALHGASAAHEAQDHRQHELVLGVVGDVVPIVAAVVVVLCAIILVLTLARLPVVDAGSLVTGSSRAVLFLSLALDVLACGLVLTAGLRRSSFQLVAWEDDGDSPS